MGIEDPKSKKVVKAAVICICILLAFALRPFKIIGAGERGVVLHFGAVENVVLNEGLHFRMPIYTSIEVVDVKTQKLQGKAEAFSKDIQAVATELALNYHVRPELANKLWQEVGEMYVERLIDPAIQESVKAATAKFTAQGLVEERPKVKEEIKLELIKRLENYFAVDEFSIVNFDFSDEYEKAVEAKQVAQQSALKAENDLKRIKVEADQRIAEATAEAEAIKIQAQAITQQGGKDYVMMQWIKSWEKGGSKVPNIITSDKAGAFIFNVDANGKSN